MSNVRKDELVAIGVVLVLVLIWIGHLLPWGWNWSYRSSLSLVVIFLLWWGLERYTRAESLKSALRDDGETALLVAASIACRGDLEAIAVVRKLAEEGSPVAQNTIGYCYGEGKGYSLDIVEAVKWFQRAADQGFPMAHFNLGECHEFGKGLDQDLGLAYTWYWMAAQKNEPDAEAALVRLKPQLSESQIQEAEARGRQQLEGYTT